MTPDPVTLTVAIALLSTHPRQPKGREIARALQDLRDQTTAPKENDR